MTLSVLLLKNHFVDCSNKPNPAAINGKMNGLDGQVSGRACESCYGEFCMYTVYYITSYSQLSC